MRPTLWLIAGPDGVGKTTYAFRHIRAVSGSADFVNLDEIARGLSPLDVEAGRLPAARIALERLSDLIATGRSFSVETTLSGRTHLRTLAQAHGAGMEVALLYFSVERVETCLSRIARRVAEGGHAVPEVDARRRYERSLRNLPAYAAASSLWRVFDANARPRVVAEGRGGCIAMRGATEGLPAELDGWLSALPPCGEA